MTGALAADLLMGPALEVSGLSVQLRSEKRTVRAVDDVSFAVNGGEIVAVVGESGSGKSVMLQSILGLLRAGPGVVAGQVTLRFRDGTEIRPYDGIEAAVRHRSDGASDVSRGWMATVERRVRPMRGRRVGLVLQNGRAALDPFYSVGQQLMAAVSSEYPRDQAEYWLERLGFEDPASAMKLYPHELSGGMAQRVMLAVVLAKEPEVLLLDEVTTGLDVSLQAAVLDLLARLYQEVGFSAVLVTHDLGVARALSSKVVIMRSGRVDQEATTGDLFAGSVPLTAYASRLLKYGGATRPVRASLTTPTEPGAPRLQAEGVCKSFGGQGRWAPPRRAVLEDITVSAGEGECIAVVGESGSGKTTFTRVLAGLSRPDAGRVLWSSDAVGALNGPAAEAVRRSRTVLFQSAYSSLNPAMTGRVAVAETLIHNLGLDRRTALNEAAQRLAVVGLGDRADQRLAGLSGGERRRVGLIGALSAPSDVLVLDEPTAGLDAEHREGVRQLIASARDQRPARTILLVSHDLGFVVGTADRIIVLYRGHVVEDVAATGFLDGAQPHHPYTDLLWDASLYVSGAEATLKLTPGFLDPVDRGLPDDLRRAPERDAKAEHNQGCTFRGRCPVYRADSVRWSICDRQKPGLLGASALRRIACHGVNDAES